MQDSLWHNLACTVHMFSSVAIYVTHRQHTATHYTTLQHTATHCNTLQHTVSGNGGPAVLIVCRNCVQVGGGKVCMCLSFLCLSPILRRVVCVWMCWSRCGESNMYLSASFCLSHSFSHSWMLRVCIQGRWARATWQHEREREYVRSRAHAQKRKRKRNALAREKTRPCEGYREWHTKSQRDISSFKKMQNHTPTYALDLGVYA